MNDNERDTTSNTNDEFTQRLTQTLDRSVADLDAETRLRLAAIRREALSQSKWKSRAPRWTGLAIAASLLAVISAPWFAHRHTAPAHDEIGYLSVDPQMLEDMDMLQAIGESR
jgi:hypothetical protein